MNKKYDIVINRNSFYFANSEFEEYYEAETINLLKTLLLNLKSEVEIHGTKEEIFVKFIRENELGLNALLILNGLSSENLQRIITIARFARDKELSKLLNLAQWSPKDTSSDIREWKYNRVKNLVKTNESFAKGIINLFFKGSSNAFLARALPFFELQKLNLQKINFDLSAMLDTLIRYRQKGSYAGAIGNNPEFVIENILNKINVGFSCGELPKIANFSKRPISFILPNRDNPKIIIGGSFVCTTGSSQGQKARAELELASLIKKHYPKACFVGFVDGIGWYVRKGDLARIVEAYDEVFTFRADEIERFANFIKRKLEN